MTLRFNDGDFTIVAKLFQGLRDILQHWRLSLASLLLYMYILLSLLTSVSREGVLVLAGNLTAGGKQYHHRPLRSAAVAGSSLNTPAYHGCPKETQRCYTLRNLTDVQDICNHSLECRTRSALDFSLATCKWRTRTNLVHVGNTSSDCLSMDTENCTTCLQGLLDRDRDVRHSFENYSSILQRYDCRRNYSMWGCEDCKAVYMDWLCGISFDVYNKSRRIKPCLGFCHTTSTKCPYLLPSTPYCGTQSYFCPKYRDLYENSSYAHEAPCYKCYYGSARAECKLEVTNQTDPLGAASSVTTKASLAGLLIGQWLLLWLWRTLFDMPPGFA